jgi:hypothetical protein
MFAAPAAITTQPLTPASPRRRRPLQVEAAQAHGMSGATADPAALLRAYMRHGRLVDAAQLAEAHLLRASGGNPLQRQRHCNVWLPYQLLTVLQALLAREAQAARQADGASAEALQAALAGLQEALRAYLAVAAQDSGLMGKGAVALPLPAALGAPALTNSMFG